jgi:hypothetical protein
LAAEQNFFDARARTDNVGAGWFARFPVSWRHHYLLALMRLLYMWNIAAEKRLDIVVLTIATLAIGTVLPDYVIATIENPVLDIALASIVPISSLLLLWVLCDNCFNREHSVAEGCDQSGAHPEQTTNARVG